MDTGIEFAGAATASVIERTSASTGLTYEALVVGFERELGHWDPSAENLMPAGRATWPEVEALVARKAGLHGLLIMRKIDQGAFTSLSGNVKNCVLYLVGNPVIASQILDIDPSAGLYVPFRVCLYDDCGPDGASIIYDRPSYSLGALNHLQLATIGAALDRKIDGVVHALCKS